ncbi:MAG: DEAD/DEAH box helicase [Candidatus Asgardarchaeia archaeon]
MDLSEKVREAIVNILKFSEFTEVQKEAIPIIARGKNVLIIAPTGSGKTEAAMLPIFDDIITKNLEDGIVVLYITPLRALNRDIFRRLLKLGEYLGIDVQLRHGDTPPYKRRLQTLSPPQVLITTPETLQAILSAPKLRKHLSNLRYVIVDELHELICDKRGTQLSVALERAKKIAGRKLQRIGLSATIGEPKKVANFLKGSDDEVYVVEVKGKKGMEMKVEYPKPSEDDISNAVELGVSPIIASTLRMIMDKVREERGILCFTNTRIAAELIGSRIKKILGERSPYIAVHHSSLSKNVRKEAEEAFKYGKLRGIISTSSLELGIDIGHVDLVIQVSSPREVTRMLQRAGRSGHRVDRPIRALVIATSVDDIFESSSIIERAMEGKLERISIPEKPLDVLCHQIAGIVLEYKMIDVREVFDLIKRAYPYRNLSFKEFKEIVEFMNELRLIRVEGDALEVRRKTRIYYYDNLSTIPDTKTYDVFDTSSRSKIGSLDEEFVVGNIEPGSTFIIKGQGWRVLSLEDGKVNVVRDESNEAIVARWVGENIPVPYEVAQHACKIRRKLFNMVKKDHDFDPESYHMEDHAKKVVVDILKRQDEEFGYVPREDEFLLEREGKIAVLHSPFGSKVNKTISLILSHILSEKFGTINFSSDPYRIIFELPPFCESRTLERILIELDVDKLEDIVKEIVVNSKRYLWYVKNVAERFGILKKGSSISQYDIMRILSLFEGSPLEKEAMSEFFFNKLDLRRTKSIIKRLKSGRIGFKYSDKNTVSPIARGSPAIFEGWGEVFSSRAKEQIIEVVKRRINSRELILACTYCFKWMGKYTIEAIMSMDELSCPKCGAKAIAIVKNYSMEDVRKALRSKMRSKDPKIRELIKRMLKSANLFLNYGKVAVLAMGGYGIGVETAKRILNKVRFENADIYEEIVEAEKRFIYTRPFWSSGKK